MARQEQITNDVAATVTKACENINNFVANYISAATKSNAAAWQGLEDLTRNMGGLMQENVTRAVSAFSVLTSAKSPQEAAESHADFMKDSFDHAIAAGSKLSELSMRTAQGAMNPLTQHANDAMGAMMKAAKQA